MVKQANKNDIPIIEEILLDVVMWMKKNGLQNQWNEDNIKWNSLSKDYQIEDFYIVYENKLPIGCMALTDLDKKYWPEISKGNSLYVHKLAVKRRFAGKGFSKELINFAKKLSLKNRINSLRLDCNFNRDKLRKVYENEGFVYVRKKNDLNNYDMALYMWYK